MASRGKKKTTFAKLARENKLRERRIDKQAKKDARKRAAEMDPVPLDELAGPLDELAVPVGDRAEPHDDER